jgi:hypothetical protein
MLSLVNTLKHNVLIYENRRMKPIKIVLRRYIRERGRTMERTSLRYIVSTYVNTKCIPLYNYYMLTIIKNHNVSFARIPPFIFWTIELSFFYSYPLRNTSPSLEREIHSLTFIHLIELA